MNRRSILAAYKKKSSHLQTGVTEFKSGNLFNLITDKPRLHNKIISAGDTVNLNDLLLEGSSVDYKEALETKKPRSWLKSISAFANSFGGHAVQHFG